MKTSKSILGCLGDVSPRIVLLAVALPAVALPTMVGCSGEPAPGVATSHPIQGGTNDTKHLFAVGILAAAGGGGTALCSGALIAPNLVATARHCVAAVPDEAINCPGTKFGAVTAAKNVIVTTEADLHGAMMTVAVSKIIVPTGADQTDVCGNDIALLILAQKISLPDYVTPVISPPMSDHTRYAPTVTAIGYGLTSATDSSGASAGIRRIRQGIAITCIPDDTLFANCYPSRTFPMTKAEFASGNGTCEGDSGSDAYEQDNFDAGKWFGFGVLSRGASSGSTCVGGIYTRFDAWASLMYDAAKQAATAGGYDLPPWAGGGADASTGSGDASSDGTSDGALGDGAVLGDAPGTTDGAMDAAADATREAGAGGNGGSVSDASPSGASPPDASPSDASPSDGGPSDVRPEAGSDTSGIDGGTVDGGAIADALVVDSIVTPPADAGPDGGSGAAIDGGGGDAGRDAAGGSAPPAEVVVGSPSLLGCSCEAAGVAERDAFAWPMLLSVGLGFTVAVKRRRHALNRGCSYRDGQRAESGRIGDRHAINDRLRGVRRDGGFDAPSPEPRVPLNE